jgi:DNA mismatch endonuclease (patch repair protein)
MADAHTKAQRSYNMSRIRKFGNESTEKRLMRLFRENGIKGWRRHLKLPGRPDFTFPCERVVVFIDGCFWHRCPQCNWIPATNTEYWLPKLQRNLEKDREADRLLHEKGWAIIRIWEHELRRIPDAVIARITSALKPRS